jgi:hypothetical protein
MMKSVHAPKRARFAAAAALLALALTTTGCFAMGAAAANDTPPAPAAKREAPPIPAPGMLQDEGLEKQLVDRMLAKGTMVAARIIFDQNDWRFERNENSGVVEARVTDATVLYKKQDGTCWQDPSLLRQQHEGSGFVAPGEWALLMNEPYESPCEKAGL